MWQMEQVASRIREILGMPEPETAVSE
jgi:hypothetical protein